MIVSEYWPAMPLELTPVHVKLIGAVGAIPTHQAVEFSERDVKLIGCGMLDYDSRDIGEELGVGQAKAENYLTGAFGKLRKPYEKRERAFPYGEGKRAFPYLTYVGLRDGFTSYPDLSEWRPELEPPEALALLALASRQSILGLEDRLMMTERGLTEMVGEKLGARTHQGMVGKGFMYGFFSPDVTKT